MMGGHPIERLIAASVRHAWLVVLASAVLVAGALAYAAGHFRMTTDTTALIALDEPWRQAELRFDAAFPAYGDTTLAVIDAATPELAESAAGALAARLSSDRAHFTRVSRPDGGSFFAREGLLYGSVQDVRNATQRMIAAQPFLGPLSADPSLRGLTTALGTMLQGVKSGAAPLRRIDAPIAALADALEKQGSGEPAFFSWQTLMGAEGGTFAPSPRRLVLVKPKLDYQALEPGSDADDAIRAAARGLKLDAAHGVRVRLTGEVPLSDEEFSSLADHAWVVAAVMLTAMLAMLWFATRAWKMVAAILMTTLAGLAIAVALGLAVIGRFNLISVAFIPLFVGLGVDFGIQLGVRTQAERREGAATGEALARSGGALGHALMLAAGAICLGFLAFLPTAYVGVSELGVIAAMGMVVALLGSATLFPALVCLLNPATPAQEVGWRSMAAADAWLARNRRSVLIAFGIALVASIAVLPLVRFDFNPFHLRSLKGEAMATLADLIRDPDRSPNLIELTRPGLDRADGLARRLEKLPEVDHATTLSSFIPEDQPAKLAAIADAKSLLDLSLDPLMALPPPDDGALVQALSSSATALRDAGTAGGKPGADATRLAAQFARLARGTPQARAAANALVAQPLDVMLRQVRTALDAQPVTRASLPPALAAEWLAPDGRARIEVAPKGESADNAVLARFADAVTRIAPDATGAPISTRGAAHTIARAFVEAGVLAFALVSLLLLVVLRSFRETAFTLAPVILSIFLTLGTCVAIGQPINFANIIAFPLLFGVGAAFHIYFVMAWRGGATNLLQSSLAHAVLFSALATGTAFGALWLSRHLGTASMGKILMLSLAWTLVCALIFEPALLGPARKRT